jgi:hypothetical protein
MIVFATVHNRCKKKKTFFRHFMQTKKIRFYYSRDCLNQGQSITAFTLVLNQKEIIHN